MKVTDQTSSQAAQIEKAKTNAPSQRAQVQTPAQTDAAKISGANVEISDSAKLMNEATDIVNNTPDYRADRVAALKASIQNGTYKIDSAAIADKLVDEHFMSDFGKNRF